MVSSVEDLGISSIKVLLSLDGNCLEIKVELKSNFMAGRILVRNLWKKKWWIPLRSGALRGLNNLMNWMIWDSDMACVSDKPSESLILRGWQGRGLWFGTEMEEVTKIFWKCDRIWDVRAVVSVIQFPKGPLRLTILLHCCLLSVVVWKNLVLACPKLPFMSE